VSKENVDVVKQFETVMAARGDVDEASGNRIEKALELLDANVVFRLSEFVPGHGGDWVGHEGFLNMCKAYSRVWEPAEGLEFEFLDGGNEKVVILATFTRTARETGRSIPIKMVEVVTVRDGRITDFDAYYDDTVGMHHAIGTNRAA
jgi:ketosteroid isomerase-like protein